METKIDRRGKTDEQKKAIGYLEGGCALFGMKDDAYDQMVMAKLNGLNLKARALGKIGLEEDQLKEVPPVFLHGYNYDRDSYRRVGSDKRLRSSKYDATWLFFSSTQVYVYGYTMDMISDAKKETSKEYFYKDVTSFSTSSETTEAIQISGCTGGDHTKITRDYDTFTLNVSGEKFYCSIGGVENADQSVSAMKQKLREKKGA